MESPSNTSDEEKKSPFHLAIAKTNSRSKLRSIFQGLCSAASGIGEGTFSVDLCVYFIKGTYKINGSGLRWGMKARLGAMR